ncbi:hypothetical protein CVIRNUC_006125 [Coccomyxa viridis]|uniref:BTB domain-containing protein n=1 Tax=Coccomyxa viridis TaxID=1274662 RepID=A0AAV1IA74_9CHLO|nr:hypothetical protein CVIRNUC_006125 [Coccomyxa viridis]
MACNGGSIIASVLEHLKLEDVQLLLENRGIPSIGEKEELTDRLQAVLSEEICEFEWEQGDVPGCHAEITGAGSSMFTHHNSVYVFGGMDDERAEQMSLCRWDLSKEEGFEHVHYRGVIPAKLSAGHYAAVYGNELWVFPMPRNHNMRRVYCLDLLRYRWVERMVIGDPPGDTHWRRNLDAVMDGKQLLAIGGQAMDKLYSFNFESRTWSMRHCKRLLPSWTFGHAVRRKRSIFAYGSVQGDFGTLEVRQLDLATLEWSRVDTKGAPPPFKTHSSAAVMADKWIIHGGRRAGKFNVTNHTSVFDFATLRWSPLMAEGCMPVAREWQAAIGLQDCMVVVGGRVDIPEFEPIPISSDTMCSAVEILWHRPPSDAQPPTGRAALMRSVQELYGSTHLADVSLVVCGRHMPAHRHVLAPHSPVFERMWQHPMSEAKTAQVCISDLDCDTVELLLRYCYGCLQELPSDHSQVIELFKAADKYDVLGLVQECVARFRQLTGADEIAPLLQVAAERHSEELRAVCVDITANCLPDVLVTNSFRELTAGQPELALNFVRETSIRLGCPTLSCPSDEGCASPDSASRPSTSCSGSTGKDVQLPAAQAPPTPPRACLQQPPQLHHHHQQLPQQPEQVEDQPDNVIPEEPRQRQRAELDFYHQHPPHQQQDHEDQQEQGERGVLHVDVPHRHDDAAASSSGEDSD